MSKNTMWGGRYNSGPSKIMERINASINFDHQLYTQDIEASKAHCEMLVTQKIISRLDGEAILTGLDEIRKDIETGKFEFDASLEDIHMNIEAALTNRIGEVAGRLHTGRSRNDQVATDFRLWVRNAIDAIDSNIQDLQRALIKKAEENADTILPGLTHLQPAQPITFGHHLLAYVEMTGRDRERFADTRKRVNESPLGAAALAGTAFPIDRYATANALGFQRPMPNSLDAVSARDFVLEFLSACMITATNISRLAEELVIWTAPQFNFVRLSDAFSTGSSIMPQKRNPDAAELVRAKTGRIIGALNTLAVIIKGLPLAYSKDMQEDKEPAFDSAETLVLAVSAMAGMIDDMKINPDSMRAALKYGYPTATDLADWLVRELGLPFRRAHHSTGKIVAVAEELNCELEELHLKTMQNVEPGITKDIYSVLSIDASVGSRMSLGGTAPVMVREAIKIAKERFL